MIEWVYLALTAGAVAMASLKWLRVAQREHYLTSGYQAAFRRWTISTVPNRLLALVPWLVLWLVAVVDAQPAVVAVGAAAWLVFPLGLPLTGRTSPLAWTGRLRRLAGVFAVLVVIGGGLALISGPAGAAAALPVIAWIGLPVAMLIATPIEHRLSRRFVDEATATLRRVDPTVVAITGSYGKTSTKEYVRHLLAGSRQVVASPASFNNRMGLARAVNEHLADGTEVFIAEMGTYAPGEIADLCGWVRPAISVITAIGPVHLERFGTEERIVAAKSEIFAGAGVAILNVDDERLAALADTAPAPRTVRCSTLDTRADVAVIAAGHRIELRRGGRSIGRVDHPGVFLTNLACAVAVALELGVDEATILDRIATVPRPAHRQTVLTSDAGVTIIDDTYNSNPAGAAAALERLVGLGSGGRRVVVTPGMVELGRRQRSENEAFARQAAQVASDLLIVGRTNRAALRKGTAGGAASVIVMPDRERAVEWVRRNLGPGDAVLYENDLPDHYP